MITTYQKYNEERINFFKKHNKGNGYKTETSPMDEYGVYYKTYVFDDKAIWYERMAPVWRTVVLEGEVAGVKIKQEAEVKLFEVEYFNTDNATSKKYYEKF